jgi:hypothetical protein
MCLTERKQSLPTILASFRDLYAEYRKVEQSLEEFAKEENRLLRELDLL